MVQAERLETPLEPILKVEFLVTRPFALNEFALTNGLDAQFENCRNLRHDSIPLLCGKFFVPGKGMKMIDVIFDFITDGLQYAQSGFNGIRDR